jgi:hypothetical protein
MSWFHHGHRSREPPQAVFIRRLNLHIYYHHRRPTVATASLSWTEPTTRTDGSPLAATDIAKTDIFDSTGLTPLIPIGTVQGAANSFVTGVLSVGPHNFTVVVTDTTGHASASSNVASVTVAPTLANPSAVTDLAAALNP